MSNHNVDNVWRQKIAELNMLKEYSYTPQNVVLVTVDDIIELIHEVQPYSMQKLDEAQRLKEELGL